MNPSNTHRYLKMNSEIKKHIFLDMQVKNVLKDVLSEEMRNMNN